MKSPYLSCRALVAALALVSLSPAAAATYAFNFHASGADSAFEGSGSFTTSGNDGVFSLGHGIQNLTGSVRFTDLPSVFGDFSGALPAFSFPLADFSVTLAGGNLLDIQASGGLAGVYDLPFPYPFDLDYDLSYSVDGIGPGNLHATSQLSAGPVSSSDTLVGDVTFTRQPDPPPTPQQNGFDIRDGQISSSVFSVTDAGLVSGLDLTMLDLAHTYAGDLTFSLSHLGTTVVFADPWGDRVTAFGSSIDLDGDYTIVDGATPTFFDALLHGGELAPGTYGTTSPFSAFRGMEKAGDWILSIADNQKADEGSLGRWSLVFPTIWNAGSAAPEAATWTLMVLGFGLAGWGLRRRRLAPGLLAR